MAVRMDRGREGGRPQDHEIAVSQGTDQEPDRAKAPAPAGSIQVKGWSEDICRYARAQKT